MIIETSLLNKILVDDKFRTLSEYLAYLKFWNVEFKDNLAEEIVILYATCRMLNKHLKKYSMYSKNSKKALILNTPDIYGVATIAFALFCDFDLVISYMENKEIEKMSKDFIKNGNIRKIQFSDKNILEKGVKNISSFFGIDETIQLDFLGSDYQTDDIKTSTYIALNTSFDLEGTEEPVALESLDNRLFTRINKNYIPF